MMDQTDLLVVGAGPAGMAAAITARRLGLSVIVADENGAPGGQIYRSILANRHRPRRDRLLGADYRSGRDMADDFVVCGADFRAQTTVIEITDDGTASLLGPERGAYVVRAAAVLIATGAYERPLPVPGWTLPGVMTAGSAQTLLKASGQVPTGRIVLAGGGPLLWYAASQLRAAGAEVAAVLSFTPASAYLRNAAAALAAWRNTRELMLGAAWLGKLLSSRTLVRHGARLTHIDGAAPELRVHYESGGRVGVEEAAVVLLHADLIPNIQAGKTLRLDHDWDAVRDCWRPRVDTWGVSSHAAILVAGDGAGIAGARDAIRGGQLAALGLANRLGRVTNDRRDREAAPLLAQRASERHLRSFFDRLFVAPKWTRIPADDNTIVCRCEEVTAAAVRAAVRLGASGPNQVKAYVRAGMGACQGRLCAHTIAALVASERGIEPKQVPTQNVRPPLKPVHVGDLAGMDIGVEEGARRSFSETLLHAPETAADDRPG
jgi:NADPH-dependent 2,4-dienoyl-CoA reductase/sulfur reductase-like enzyme